MNDNEKFSVPTASENMLQPSKVSARQGIIGNQRSSKKGRIRSKSESTHGGYLPSDENNSEVFGLVIKTQKERENDRKPRNLKGNGKPKKGGGGGKGTWGKNGEVYEEENLSDPNDPNYEPENKVSEIVMTEVVPDLKSPEFDRLVTPIVQEYYDHGMTMEVAGSLSELNITHLKHRVVYLVVSMAMERKGSDRELTSILISDLYGQQILYEQDIELGFQALMNNLEDLSLDTPDAPEILGQFMARCVADDCLSPCYIDEHLEHPSGPARTALEKAHVLLRMKHGIVRLDTIWGHGGGIRPVKVLRKEIILLLKEFLSSNDIKEAERCLAELDVPHFHHEVVYEALFLALDDGGHKTFKMLTTLLKHFSTTTMITDNQIVTGFERIYKNMDDLVLDIPRAYKHLDVFLEMCCRVGVISLGLRQKAPFRGRKRFVSEGDFGLTDTSSFLGQM